MGTTASGAKAASIAGTCEGSTNRSTSPLGAARAASPRRRHHRISAASSAAKTSASRGWTARVSTGTGRSAFMTQPYASKRDRDPSALEQTPEAQQPRCGGRRSVGPPQLSGDLATQMFGVHRRPVGGLVGGGRLDDDGIGQALGKVEVALPEALVG